MEKIIPELKKALDSRLDCAVVTVVRSSGSVPRGPGACMLVLPDGSTVGTVGGGALELQAVKTALDCISRSFGTICEYSLGSGSSGGLGMVCGGSVVLHFRCVSPDDDDALALACASSGSLSFELLPDGSGKITLQDDPCCDAGVRIKDGREFFFRSVCASPRALVFGGGHVARALVPVLSSVGFRCTVLENRAGFLTRENFPTADRLLETELAGIMSTLCVTDADYIVIMTYGHESDFVLTREALGTPAKYIGVLGSRAKAAHARERLRAEGFPQSQLDRIICPVGLPLGGPTPEEIAVSITAQMIAVRYGKA